MDSLFKTVPQHSLLSESFLSDVKGSLDGLFSSFYSDTSCLKNYLNSHGILTENDGRHFIEFLSFNEIPSALYLEKVLIDVRNDAQKRIIKLNGGKPLLEHIIEVLKKKINGIRIEFMSNDVKQMVYYLWSVIRNNLPGINSNVADQLLLIIFEQF